METKKQPTTKQPPTIKKTLSQLHQELKEVPINRQQEVLKALGLKSRVSFYDILNGTKILSPADKKAIAEIYNVTVEDIDWQDDEKTIA